MGSNHGTIHWMDVSDASYSIYTIITKIKAAKKVFKMKE
jgi:hypothetical protein